LFPADFNRSLISKLLAGGEGCACQKARFVLWGLILPCRRTCSWRTWWNHLLSCSWT